MEGQKEVPREGQCPTFVFWLLEHAYLMSQKQKENFSYLFWLRKRLNRITEIARILFLNFSGQHVQNRILWAQGPLWEMRLLCSSGRGAP